MSQEIFRALGVCLPALLSTLLSPPHSSHAQLAMHPWLRPDREHGISPHASSPGHFCFHAFVQPHREYPLTNTCPCSKIIPSSVGLVVVADAQHVVRPAPCRSPSSTHAYKRSLLQEGEERSSSLRPPLVQTQAPVLVTPATLTHWSVAHRTKDLLPSCSSPFQAWSRSAPADAEDGTESIALNLGAQ